MAIKGKKIKEISPLEGVIGTLDMIANPTQKHRKDIFRTEKDNWIVDTCKPTDTQTWETGVCRDGVWIIVEQYENKEKAEKGHNKWIKAIEKNPKLKLQDIDIWGINKS